MNIAVILAGGVGNRLGAGIPKQFVEILGKPILAYTIEPFDKHPDVDAILVVCVKPYMDYIWELKKKYNFKKLKWVTEGGATFQESVMNGMNYLSDKAQKDDTVLFHFGASPFIKPDIITDVIKVCKEKGSNAISTTDYLLLSGLKKNTSSVSEPDNYTEEYINRDTIAVMNTPHAFQYGFLVNMYNEAVETGVINSVEPHTTTLMYAMGKRIYFSKGSQDNIKITTKDDLEMFEGYVLEQQRKSKEKVEGDVIVFLADGFEECEGLLIVDLLRRAGLKVIMASIMGRRDVRSSRDIIVQADCLAENVEYSLAQMIVLPGGRIGTDNLSKNNIVNETCKLFSTEKYLAAVSAAPSILASLGLLDDRKATVHPDYSDVMHNVNVLDEAVVVDGHVITGQGLGATMDFSFELIRILVGNEKVQQIKKAICYRE